MFQIAVPSADVLIDRKQDRSIYIKEVGQYQSWLEHLPHNLLKHLA
jgi:hypothetical protein